MTKVYQCPHCLRQNAAHLQKDCPELKKKDEITRLKQEIAYLRGQLEKKTQAEQKKERSNPYEEDVDLSMSQYIGI